MTRFSSAVAAAVLASGLAAAPALARDVAPVVPQGLSIDSIRTGQPEPGDQTDDMPGTPGLRGAIFTDAGR